MCFDFVSKAVRRRLSDRVLKGMNLFAAALMLTSIALRFYYLAVTGTEATPSGSVLFMIVLAIYQIVIIGLLVAAEF